MEVVFKVAGKLFLGCCYFFGMLKQCFFKIRLKSGEMFSRFLLGNVCCTYWLPPHSLQNSSGTSYLQRSVNVHGRKVKQQHQTSCIKPLGS